MSRDPNREIVIRSVSRSWGLLMKRLTRLSAGEEQQLGVDVGILSEQGSGLPSSCPPDAAQPGSPGRITGEKRSSVVSGKLEGVVFLAGICPRAQELGELLSRAEDHPRKGFWSPSSSSQCLAALQSPSPECCNAQAHLEVLLTPSTALLAPRAWANPSVLAWGCRHI